jgi:dolichol phosphate-mannose biosynthesis regulatory protein
MPSTPHAIGSISDEPKPRRNFFPTLPIPYLMTAGDKLVGVAGLVLSIAIFAYYTTWVLVAPFVDNSVTSFHRFFPDRWWAIAGPCVLLAAAVTFVATFMRYVSSKKR